MANVLSTKGGIDRALRSGWPKFMEDLKKISKGRLTKNKPKETKGAMKDKYLEERFKRYFKFGREAISSLIDVSDGEDSAVCTVTHKEADKLIKQRDEVIDFLCEMAQAFNESNPDDFNKFFYGTK